MNSEFQLRQASSSASGKLQGDSWKLIFLIVLLRNNLKFESYNYMENSPDNSGEKVSNIMVKNHHFSLIMS